MAAGPLSYDHKPGVVGATETLNYYWTRGRGLARWSTSAHPWTTLRNLLFRYIGDMHQAEGLATEYVKIVFHGLTPGNDAYRAMHGGKIRGKRIGPG